MYTVLYCIVLYVTGITSLTSMDVLIRYVDPIDRETGSVSLLLYQQESTSRESTANVFAIETIREIVLLSSECIYIYRRNVNV